MAQRDYYRESWEIRNGLAQQSIEAVLLHLENDPTPNYTQCQLYLQYYEASPRQFGKCLEIFNKRMGEKINIKPITGTTYPLPIMEEIIKQCKDRGCSKVEDIVEEQAK
jgi:hypothetical protein